MFLFVLLYNDKVLTSNRWTKRNSVIWMALFSKGAGRLGWSQLIYRYGQVWQKGEKVWNFKIRKKNRKKEDKIFSLCVRTWYIYSEHISGKPLEETGRCWLTRKYLSISRQYRELDFMMYSKLTSKELIRLGISCYNDKA